jgi:hypothetical protein
MRNVDRRASFKGDVVHQFSWYFERVGEDISWKFVEAVNKTVMRLSLNPALGRARQFQNPRLQNLRSFPVETPFERFLIFFRVDENTITMERLEHFH